MSACHIAFPTLAWERGGHPQERKRLDPRVPGAILLEFGPGFSDPAWCVRGHAGLVLTGSLGLELEDARMIVAAGEGFTVDPGTRHRAFNPGSDPVELFIVTRDA